MFRCFRFLAVQWALTLLHTAVKFLRTAIALQTVAKNNGVQVSTVAADSANGMKFQNDGSTELHIAQGTGARVVTVRSVACSHGRTADVVVNVAANTQANLGPFDQALFNQADGTVNVDFDAATNTTIGAMQKSGLKQ
jgi:tRNA(Phe) wybutosine-synthesizing methylase Tyw3